MIIIDVIYVTMWLEKNRIPIRKARWINYELKFVNIIRSFRSGQEPRKAKTNGPMDRGHFNGLDRLDSKNRVYSAETSVPWMIAEPLGVEGWMKSDYMWLLY